MVRATLAPAAAPSARLGHHGKIYQKGMSTDALLKKLSALRDELSQLEQDGVDVRSLDETRRQLISPTLMLHKDRSVKAALACCLADMLRLYAPDAPFTAHELKDIFQFFLHQLLGPHGGLAKPGSPCYQDCCYLLESLSSVKSVVLVCDLPSADDMMVEIFRGFFALVRPETTKNIEIAMSDILVQLIDECVSVPAEVLELLLANFHTKVQRTNPASHQLAVEVCQETKEKLQKHVAQYFNEAIISASDEHDDEDREKALRSCHALIVQIHRAVPALLLNVVPQVEEELRAADVMVRQIATKSLGQMFGERAGRVGVGGGGGGAGSSGGDLAKRYASTWREWLGRSRDRAPALRVSWVEATAPLLAHHPELREDLASHLVEKLSDPDDRVRVAMVRVLGAVDYETALHHVPVEVLRELGLRCRDRKAHVRGAALDALGRLYRLARNEIESRDAEATAQFAWIPSELFACLYTSAGGPDMRMSVLAAVERYVLRLPAGTDAEEEARWVNRLLLVMKHLDASGTKVLLHQLTNLTKPRGLFRQLVASIEAHATGGGGGDGTDGSRRQLAHYVRFVSRMMPDEERAARDLQALAKLGDARMLRLLGECLDADVDLGGLVKARAELVRRVKDQHADVLDTVENLLRLGSLHVVNRSAIPHLLRRLQNSQAAGAGATSGRPSASAALAVQGRISALEPATPDDADADAIRRNVEQLLDLVSRTQPGMYRTHFAELWRSLTLPSANDATRRCCLRALAALASHDVSRVNMDAAMVARLATLARSDVATEARHAAKLLAVVGVAGSGTDRAQAGATTAARTSAASSSSSSPPLPAKTTRAAREAVDTLVRELAHDVGECKGAALAARLAGLGQLIKHAPEQAADAGDVITRHVLGDVIMAPWAECGARRAQGKDGAAEDSAEDEDTEADWVEDTEVPWELRAKLLGLEVLARRCVAYADMPGIESIAQPVLRLLFHVLAHGEPRAARQDGAAAATAAARSRMRLQASVLLLKMARRAPLERLIKRDFVSLALMVQDECFEARSRFIHKLLVYQSRGVLAPRFNAIPFLAAFDPDAENRDMVRNWAMGYASLPADVRIRLFDMPFVRFLHLLAHHPDFSRDTVAEVRDMARYVAFYLECIATPANVALLYHLAGRLKGVQDAEGEPFSGHLYALSELAQLLIRRCAQLRGWALLSYPGKVQLPADIFRSQPNAERLRETYEKVHLPAETEEALGEMRLLRGGGAARASQQKKRKRPAAADKGGSAVAAAAKGAKKARRRRPRREVDEDEDEDGDGDEDGHSDGPEGEGEGEGEGGQTSESEGEADGHGKGKGDGDATETEDATEAAAAKTVKAGREAGTAAPRPRRTVRARDKGGEGN